MNDYILFQAAILNFVTKYTEETITSFDLQILTSDKNKQEIFIYNKESFVFPLWFFNEDDNTLLKERAQRTILENQESHLTIKVLRKNKILNALNILFFEVLFENGIDLFNEKEKVITNTSYVATNSDFYQSFFETQFTKYKNYSVYAKKEQWKKVFNGFFSKLSPADEMLIVKFTLNNSIANLNHQLWNNKKAIKIVQLFPKETSYCEEGEVEHYLLQLCISDVGMKTTIQRTILPVLRDFLKHYKDSKEEKL